MPPCHWRRAHLARGTALPEACAACTPGHLRAMSAENACPRNTYREASGSTSCTECPLLSSADEASQSVTDCTCARFESRVARSCEAGCALCPEEPPGRVNGPQASPHRPAFAPGAAGFFMMDNLDADPSCALCPQPGANCTAPGATLSRLQLMPGYWRRSNTSIAVLACAAHRRRDPASPTHPSRFDRASPLPALPGAPMRTATISRVAAAAQRRAARGEACLGSTAHSALRSRRGSLQPPSCSARHRAPPASHAP